MDQAEKLRLSTLAIAKIFSTNHKLFQVYIQSSKGKTIEQVDFKFIKDNKKFVINLSLKYKLYFVQSCWSARYAELQDIVKILHSKDNFIDQVT